jgi:hypothetical protein
MVVFRRDPSEQTVTLSMSVDSGQVASQTATLSSPVERTAAESWTSVVSRTVAVEHTVQDAGTYDVTLDGIGGDTYSESVTVLNSLPSQYDVWRGAGSAGADSEFGTTGAGELVVLAGTDTDAWERNNAFATAYLTDGLEDGGTVTVQVVDHENTSIFAKGGIVVRNDMDAPAAEPGGKGMVRVVESPPETINRGSEGDTTEPEDGRFALEWDKNGDGTASDAPFPPTYTAQTTASPVWLRLEKSRTDYTAYYSTDGTNFTQYRTATVPQAAATQDVGVWCVSLAAERSRMVFDDFTVQNP